MIGVLVASWLAVAALDVSTSTPPSVLALVIGNNAGADDLPTLAYADDDAVRMAALLRQTGATVELLTRLDTDTSRTTADVPTGPPTRAAFAAATTRLAKRAATTTTPTVFMLYFAGHGDAEQGAGALLLQDDRLHFQDLRAAIDEVKATTTHVVLDACNAFFVVHARGAGGRAWATPSTAGASLSSTVSDVGVFVSTSAEAQVFEWSQLQGGIFSHALRSGLRGAADANVDGVVTYAELEGFIRVATDGIVNAAYVPQLFARAPQHTTALLDVRGTPGTRLEDAPALGGVAESKLLSQRRTRLAGPGRLTVRDGSGAVVLEVHPEPGFVAEVLLPTGPLLLERLDEHGQWSEQPFEATSTAATAAPPTSLAKAAARGPAGLLQRLFAQPFGPMTLQAFAAHPRPPEVFGVSVAQELRLRLYLQALRDDAERTRQAARWGSTTFAVATGVGFSTAAAVFAAQGESTNAAVAAVTGLGFAGFGGVLATGVLNGPGDAQRAADALLSRPSRSTDLPGVRAAHVANTIDTITGAADTFTGTQQALVVIGIVTAGVAVGFGALAIGCPSCVDNREPEQARTAGTFLLFAGALSASMATMAAVLPGDANRLEALMRNDPESVSQP